MPRRTLSPRISITVMVMLLLMTMDSFLFRDITIIGKCSFLGRDDHSKSLVPTQSLPKGGQGLCPALAGPSPGEATLHCNRLSLTLEALACCLSGPGELTSVRSRVAGALPGS